MLLIVPAAKVGFIYWITHVSDNALMAILSHLSINTQQNVNHVHQISKVVSFVQTRLTVLFVKWSIAYTYPQENVTKYHYVHIIISFLIFLIVV